jgi:hypothetical protein
MCTKSCLINSIEMLRDEAWHQSLKYRYDPVLSKVHDKFLQNLNVLVEHAKSEGQNENIR